MWRRIAAQDPAFGNPDKFCYDPEQTNWMVVMELNAVDLQIPYHGQDHGLVLVIAGEAQRFEIRQTAHMVDEALDVPLHLQSWMSITG